MGATVDVGGALYEQAEAEARRRAAARGVTFVSAYDDPLIQAGNGGSLAAEILEQRPDTTHIVVPVGGGGLIGGMTGCGVRLTGVQPEANCAMFESLKLGRALTVYHGGPTLAEGCEGAVAESTYALCRDGGVGIALVSEDGIRRAMAFAYSIGLVVEPSSAVALAGILDGAVAITGPTVVVVTGGNVEPDLLDEVLRA
jgi:threonine dehydratase